MAILILNIKELIQVEEQPRAMVSGEAMSKLDTITDAWLFLEGDRIVDFGKMPGGRNVPVQTVKEDVCGYLAGVSRQTVTVPPGSIDVIDAAGRMVFPSFCDSHTHLVYAGSREIEYIDKIRGLSYEEIARRGGGILNSARRLHDASEEELIEQALPRLKEIISYGTGAVEIKSGYGLNTEDELKMLRVIRRLQELTPVTIVPTFLGAHAVPAEYRGRQGAFVDEVIGEMIPRVAGEKLAAFIDVFCDRGFFTVEETSRMLEAGIKHGLQPKIHANELDYSGGIQVGVKYHALSVDHLEYTGSEEISCLKDSGTMPTVLPGAAFFLDMVYAPVRDMINAGLPVAMASDFNPGSSPSGNMQFILSMACIKYRMLPEEAIHAVTLNGAYAMGLERDYGSIARGKKANLFISVPIPSYSFMPYAFGSNKVATVILNGKVVFNE
ncbi:MAG TPA: imidazolonepropionase [Bacteroidales bacterium]|nr:imidazolonepropionase [Bacteroidales bacterium]HPS50456.1 imidazolonepropionase [Bacteroidales bacterium]